MGINSFPKPSKVENEGEKPRSDFIVGATRNPDGTWNYSKALSMDDTKGGIAEGFEKLRQEEKQNRAKRLEIPSDVRPGTVDMVLHNLENAIFVQEKIQKKNRREWQEGRKFTKEDSRTDYLLEKLKAEKSLLNKLGYNLYLPGQEEGVSASRVSDELQRYIDNLQAKEDRNKGNKSFEGIYVNDIKKAEDLLRRLMDEESKG